MDSRQATKFGDLRIIRILNNINEKDKKKFYCELANKTSEMTLSETKKARINELAKIRIKELNE